MRAPSIRRWDSLVRWPIGRLVPGHGPHRGDVVRTARAPAMARRTATERRRPVVPEAGRGEQRLASAPARDVDLLSACAMVSPA